MNLRVFLLAALLFPLSASAVGWFNSNHPEEAYPDNIPPLASPGEYGDFISQVQQKLRDAGFDAGPVNGAFGTKTQAALVQYQLSQTLPASGSLDDATLKELGVQRPAQAD